MPSTIALARPRTAALDPYSQTSLVNELAVPGRTYCCAPRSRLLATAPLPSGLARLPHRFAARQSFYRAGRARAGHSGEFVRKLCSTARRRQIAHRSFKCAPNTSIGDDNEYAFATRLPRHIRARLGLPLERGNTLACRKFITWRRIDVDSRSTTGEISSGLYSSAV